MRSYCLICLLVFSAQALAQYVGPVVPPVQDVSISAGNEVSIPLLVTNTEPNGKLIDVKTDGMPGLTYDLSQNQLFSDAASQSATEFKVSVTAHDDAGNSASQYFRVDFGVPNMRPEFVMPDYLPRFEPLSSLSYQLESSDPNEGDTVAFVLSGEPDGMAIDENGILGWVADKPDEYRDQLVYVTGEDSAGEKSSQFYLFPNGGGNTFPQINPVERLTFPANQPISFAVSLLENGGHYNPVFALTGSPEGMEVDSATGVINWQSPRVGQYQFSVAVSTNTGYSRQYITLVAGESLEPAAPHLKAKVLESAIVGVNFAFQVEVAGIGAAEAGQFEIYGAPAGMTVSQGGLVSWVPVRTQRGIYRVQVALRTTNGMLALQEYLIHFGSGNRTPMILTTKMPAAKVGEEYRFKFSASDPEPADILRYELIYKSEGMNFDQSTGELTWSPSANDVKEHILMLVVRDQHHQTNFRIFNLNFGNPNTPARLIPETPLSARQGAFFEHKLLVKDPDRGEDLDFELKYQPDGMSVDNEGVMHWLPTAEQIGWHKFNATVRENRPIASTPDSRSYYVFVAGDQVGNQPPTIISAPSTSAYVDIPYRYQVVVTDEDDLDNLAFSLNVGPSGMSISAGGEISWMPGREQIGIHSVELSASDAEGNKSTQAFNVVVDVPESDSTIIFSTAPITSARVGEEYTYRVIANSTANAAITYHLVVGPANADIDHDSGIVRWVPAESDVGSNPFVVKAIDSIGNWAEQKFTVDVMATATVIKITSSPVISVPETKRYEYQLIVDPSEGQKDYNLIASPAGARISASGKIEWTPNASYAEPLTTANDRCSIEPWVHGTFEPVLKWHWNGGQVRHVPLVAQMSDDNGDGAINQHDRADVVFIAYQAGLFKDAWIEVLDGSSGIPLSTFQKPLEHFPAYGQLALGDVDNDGIVEIVATTSTGQLVLYDHSGGAPKWSVTLPDKVNVMNHVALYDLDGDGNTEILAGRGVFNTQGGLLWLANTRNRGASDASCGPCSLSHGDNYNQAAIAMDILDQYPGQEVIIGDEVYSSSGGLIWSGAGPDGFVAVGDIDNDGLAEIVVDAITGTYVYENTGEQKWYRSHISGGAPPTLADVDGDGFLEIGLASKPYYVVLNHDGTRLWQVSIEDGSSGITGSTVFDFEGDGKADIVYFDEDYLRVYDETGKVKFSIANNSGTWTEYPVIADLEGDGHADIVIPSSDSQRVSGAANATVGVRAFQDANNSWMGTRSIWNQHAYHIDNINDDGSIPAVPAASYKTHNTFRLSAYPDRRGVDRTDVALSGLQLVQDGSRYLLSVDVSNRSTYQAVQPGVVKIFNGDPAQGSLLLEQPIASLQPGQVLHVSQEVNSGQVTNDLFAVLEYGGAAPECVTDNNTLRAALFNVRVQDESGNSDQQMYAVSVKNVNQPPSLISQPVVSTVWGNPYQYTVEAEDPDRADVLRFELINAPQGMQINSQTGEIVWSPTLDQLASFDVQVKVSDLDGLFDIQEFALVVEENPLLNRAPVLLSSPVIYQVQKTAFSRWLQASDPDNEDVRFSLASGPQNMRLTSSGFLTLSDAAYRAPGIIPFIIKLTDERGLSRTFEMSLWITQTVVPEGTAPPQVVGPSSDVVFVTNTSNQYALSLPDVAAGYNYSIETGPAGLTISGNVLSWAPTDANIGIYPVTVRLGNGTFSYSYTFNLHVRNTTDYGPQMDLNGFPGELYINEPFEFQFAPFDPDGDPVTLTIPDLPATASLSVDNKLTWTPSSNDIGPKVLTIHVDDGLGLVATFTLQFSVKAYRNNPPQFLQLAPRNFAGVGRDYSYQFLTTDPDNDPISFALLEGPAGMSITQSGLLSLPSVPDSLVGDHTVRVQISDGNGGTNTATFPLRIDFNQPPVITTEAAGAAYVGETYTYAIRATDPEGYVLSYAIASGPQGMSIDAAKGTVSWRPSVQQIGMHFIDIVVRDDQGGEQHQIFDLTVYSGHIMHRNVCQPGDQE